MKNPPYWFPVRPARRGWGWDLPTVWQGWVALALFLAALTTGMTLLPPHGKLVTAAFVCAWGLLLIALMWWKGEPQSMRDERQP